jgi:hypothetical protein
MYIFRGIIYSVYYYDYYLWPLNVATVVIVVIVLCFFFFFFFFFYGRNIMPVIEVLAIALPVTVI